MEWIEGEYRITNDKSLISVDRTYALLSRSFWGNERNKENIRLSMEHSICYGVFAGPKQVGFGRVVTDTVTVYWLCDVYLEEAYRRRGLGKRLIQCMVETPELKGLLGILATTDAHGLYEKFGFVQEARQFMLRRRTQD